VVVKNTDKDKTEGLLGLMLVAVPSDAQDETTSVGNFSVRTFICVLLAYCAEVLAKHLHLDTSLSKGFDFKGRTF